MKEQWKIVEGFENYAISNKGRVFTFNRLRYLTPKLHATKGFYLYVNLYKGCRYKSFKIHQLVAYAFIGDRPKDKDGDFMVVHHKDHNRHNNDVNNLEYITKLQNWRLKMLTGEYTPKEKEEDVPDWVKE